jgi:adenosine kinase
VIRTRNVVVCGALARDVLLTCTTRFREHLLEDQGPISVSFPVDDVRTRPGGAAANIAYGVSRLGLRPCLVGSVGEDAGPLVERLAQFGVDVESVRISGARTPTFYSATDAEGMSLGFFYSGRDTGELAEGPSLGSVHTRLGNLDAVVITPHDPGSMLRFAEDARSLSPTIVADPGQQVTALSSAALARLAELASLVVVNSYERAMLRQRTQWTEAELLRRSKVLVTTAGPDGCEIASEGSSIAVPAVPATVRHDAVGAGDAFRAGIVGGLVLGLDVTRSAQLGAAMASFAVEADGPQEYELDPEAMAARLRLQYGAGAADEIRRALPG